MKISLALTFCILSSLVLFSCGKEAGPQFTTVRFGHLQTPNGRLDLSGMVGGISIFGVKTTDPSKKFSIKLTPSNSNPSITLPNGNYRFAVLASNSDNVFSSFEQYYYGESDETSLTGTDVTVSIPIALKANMEESSLFSKVQFLLCDKTLTYCFQKQGNPNYGFSAAENNYFLDVGYSGFALGDNPSISEFSLKSARHALQFEINNDLYYFSFPSFWVTGEADKYVLIKNQTNGLKFPFTVRLFFGSDGYVQNLPDQSFIFPDGLAPTLEGFDKDDPSKRARIIQSGDKLVIKLATSSINIDQPFPLCPNALFPSCYNNSQIQGAGVAVTPKGKFLRYENISQNGGSFSVLREIEGERWLAADGSDTWSSLNATARLDIEGRSSLGLFYTKSLGEYSIDHFGITSWTTTATCNYINDFMNDTNVCASRNMRLPRMDEVMAPSCPSTNNPCSPTCAYSSGIPNVPSLGTWSATSFGGHSDYYWTYTSSSPISILYSLTKAVRCVSL